MSLPIFRKPMLAQHFNPARVLFPCFVQPKLDGIRCITDGRTFWSRNGKEFSSWNMHHLRSPKRLKFLVDAELTLADGADFEDLSSIARRHKHADCEDLRLNVFDVMLQRKFVDRLEFTREMWDDELNEFWWLVPTTLVRNMEELKERHRYHLKLGREGTMVRSTNGLYEFKRSFHLMKYKPLLDAEFEIVDVLEAKGKDKGTPILMCWTGKGRIDDINEWFRVRPKGTLKQRRKMWRDRADLPGQMTTVEFQNLTKYGVPRFPRAKVLRDYE